MRYLELVLHLVSADLRTEVARRFLGFLWWILEPVMYMAVFYVVFGLGMRQGGPGYVPFLLCGMVPWKWFDGSVRQTGNSIVGNSALMQQIFVPKCIFGLVQILTNTFKFLVVLSLLLVFLIALGHRPSIEWFGLLPLMLTQLALIAGLGLLFASIIPFAHDLRQVIDNVMMLMMFMSGIFFSADAMPEGARQAFGMNPMVGIIDSYRAVLMHNAWPDWGELGYALALAVPMLALALVVIARYERHYPKLIY